MALLNDGLSLWEIAFRWAGYDPDRFWLRPPLPVRDNFRTLMDAILRGHLDCDTLSLRKYYPQESNGAGPEYFIRHYMDEVYACIGGRRFDRKLLKWAYIERWAIQQWCVRQGVPLPEFWFPPGWKLEYEWPDETDDTEEERGDTVDAQATPPESQEEKQQRLDKRHKIKIACQQIALSIWAKEPNATIKEIAWRKEIQDLGGGSDYEIETVEAWLGEIDPRSPARKRGRKRKNNSPPSDSGSSSTD